MAAFHAIDLAGLKQVASTMAEAFLSFEKPIVCWILGPMGAGKTTLTREVLYALGLDKSCAVTSPTFTYMNEYRIDNDWFAHLDLYRATRGLSVEDLGVNDVRDYRALFIEWPASFEDSETHLKPTHKIDISVLSETTRSIVFSVL